MDYPLIHLLGDTRWKPCDKQSWAQRTGHVADRMLRSFRMLDADPLYVLSQHSGSPSRLRRLVVQVHRGAGDHQQLYQSVHICCQVSQIPRRRERADQENQTRPTAVADFCDCVTWHSHLQLLLVLCIDCEFVTYRFKIRKNSRILPNCSKFVKSH